MPRIPVFIYTADPATGNALPSVTCTVKNRITNTNVSLFSAETGGSSVTNPLTSDSLGRAFAWTERVPLKIDYSGAGITAYTEYRGDGAQPTFESTLPSSPYDGQEIYYQNAALATAGVVWHFRYRSGGGTYKWECIGPTPLIARDGTLQNTLAASNGVATAFSPAVAITLPLAGDYLVRYGAILGHTGNNQGMSVVPIATGLSYVGANRAQVVQPATVASSSAPASGEIIATGISGTLELRYESGATGGTAYHKWISATPIRVG